MLKIGTLGAARITPWALTGPARDHPGVVVDAVAARDPDRAAAFARRQRIARVLPDYQRLISDPALDAVYIPLPNALHARWAIAAVQAGKHVLLEKPFAANQAEAQAIVDAAEQAGRVCMEAFHWRYHPMAKRMVQLVQSGALGAIQHVETRMCVPMLFMGDIRYRWDLAGGALMDIGAYAVHMLRTLGGEVAHVVDTQVRTTKDPRIDRWIQADLALESGAQGRITASLCGWPLLSLGIVIQGERGELRAINPLAPHVGWHRLKTILDGRTQTERFPGPSTYRHQLDAFAAAIQGGPAPLTGGADAVANHRTMDAIYTAAGLPLREGHGRAG